MKLQLKKPIIFFDLETTGINLMSDRIVEISLIKVMPNGEEIEKTRRINPGMHIPEEASKVHGIYDEDVASCPSFKQVAKDLANIFTGCDIAGFNSNRFDVPMLDQELRRAGIKFDFSKARFIDVQTIFHKREPRNLIAAYKFYCGKDLTDAHSANADTRATYEVLMAQYDRYEDLPTDMAELSEYSGFHHCVDLMGRLIYDDQGREIINFGKYKGCVAADVLRKDPGYYSWILQGDFSDNTKDAFTRIKLSLKS